MAIRPPQPVSNFLAGRQARQDEDYADSRNALARFEAENAPDEMASRNKLRDLQVRGAEQQLNAEQAKTAYTTLRQALDSGRPREFVLQNVPLLAQKLREHKGIDLASLDDQSASQLIEDLARQYGGEAGIAPADRPVQLETIEGPDGSILQRDPTTGALKPVLGRKPAVKPEGPASQFVTLNPQEIEAAGLPAGTAAQRDTRTGKVDVLSRRDNTGTLSQKDTVTAKQKLTTIKLARQQLNNIRAKFDSIKGTTSAGAFGQGRIPSEKGKAFDAAVNQMRSTLTALTRVPGVGAMSDYETKLDQAKFPARTEYESVTADQINAVDDMLTVIERGYGDLLSGGTAQPEQQAAPQQQGPVGISNDADYASLPSGTQYRAPDGSIRTKR